MLQLFINTEEVPLNQGSYSISYSDYSVVKTTEAGTTHRDIIREGIPSIDVSMIVTDTWLKKLRNFKSQSTVAVKYYDPATLALIDWTAFIDDFKPSLKASTSAGNYWSVSFTLQDMSTS